MAGKLQTLGSMLASASRMSRGMQAHPGKAPEYLLELYSFESIPYLYDPNTERGMFESADILDYLRATYLRATYLREIDGS